jgi:hypothetical protein
METDRKDGLTGWAPSRPLGLTALRLRARPCHTHGPSSSARCSSTAVNCHESFSCCRSIARSRHIVERRTKGSERTRLALTSLIISWSVDIRWGRPVRRPRDRCCCCCDERCGVGIPFAVSIYISRGSAMKTRDRSDVWMDGLMYGWRCQVHLKY